tara:strand:+ start:48 stop:551 length:504 start_codon:yes stop_codon:yes gene_type:complete
MKSIYILLIILFPFVGFGQLTYVPDNNFEQALINMGYDDVLDDSVITSNINTVTQLILSYYEIQDLTGIEDFQNLDSLDCSNNNLTELDLSQNINLNHLSCYNNWELVELDVSQNINLLTLWCYNNLLTELDISNNVNLNSFYCFNNGLTELDVSQNVNLENCLNNA